MTTSDQIGEFAAAMVKAQAELRPAIKDSSNPAFRSKYADLSAVWDACRGPLTKHGIAVLQEVTLNDVGVSVMTRLLHSSGQWVQFDPLTVPLSKRDAHGVGSATSYGKRYALSAAIGVVAADDDDGNAAVAATKAEPAKAPAGYDEWLLDFEAAADTGSAALADGWKNAKPEYRTHYNTTKTDADRTKLRERAQKADAAVPV